MHESTTANASASSRVELPLSQAEPRIHQFSGRWSTAGDVCREPAAPEQLAVSSLEVRGGAPPRGRRLWRGRSRSSVRWCCGPLGQCLVFAGLFQRTSHSTTGSSGSCPPVRTAVMSGSTVASAAVRRRQRRSIPKTTLTSASKTLHDRFDLIHRYQTRLRGYRCDRLKLG